VPPPNNPDRPALVQLHQNLHAVLQELRLVADEILGEFDLVVGHHVHEGERVAGGEEELEILLLEIDLLHRVGRAEALVELGAGDDILELDLGIGAALARLHRLGLHRHPQPALMLDHEAGTDFIACDLGHARALLRARIVMRSGSKSGRVIAGQARKTQTNRHHGRA